jgi:hypothetical protein
MKMSGCIATLAVAASVSGCWGKLVGDEPSYVCPTLTVDGGVLTGPANEPPAVFTVHRTADEARTLCAAPNGPVDPPKNAPGFAGRLTRRWYNCNPDATSASLIESAEALEIARDGSVTALASTEGGEFSPVEGPNAQAKWAIACDNALSGLAGISIAPPGNANYLPPCSFIPSQNGKAGDADYVQFELQPRRARFEEHGVPRWYVAIDE